MSKASPHLPRRRFLKKSVAAAAAAVMAPTIIPASALGRGGAVAPSERVVVGGIGIGNRGTYDLGCFLQQPDVQFIAVCDVKESRRQAVKKLADDQYGNQDCSMHKDFREVLDRKDIDAVLIATGPNWHATMAMHAAKAGKDMYCEKLSPETEPDKAIVDWDMYLGPAAWRPFNPKLLDGFNFEKGGGLVGGGVLEWGSHCVDLCQWAVGDCPPPVEYDAPKDGQLVARYENGCELIFRETGWIPLGSCPVRFEGETGWVEAGDSGKLVLSSPALLAGRTVEEIDGYPATYHVRDFLDCVKTRSQPKGNADAACNAHIACHAANIALHLGRTVKYDNTTHEFVNDEQANRLRSEALREPWRL